MNVHLYGKDFSITDAGICEARGKYLVIESTKKVPNLIKKQVLNCKSIDEIIRKIPKLAGSIYLKTIQHLLYVLKQEGVTNLNAKKFLDFLFKATNGSAVQILCSDKLIGIGDFKSNRDKIVKYTLSAINFDLGNMWCGYVSAHGYNANIEYFPVKKFNEMGITKKLSDKNLPIEQVAELMVKILQYAPDWIEAYEVIGLRLGNSQALQTYKEYFTSYFKAGSYRDVSDGSISKERAINRLNATLRDYKESLVSNLYFCGVDEKSDSKIKAAISHYADVYYGEIPLVCYDDTVFGDASDGFLVTTKGIYVHNYADEEPIYFDYSQITSIEVKGFVSSSLYINGIKINTSGKNKKFRKNLCEALLLVKKAFMLPEKQQVPRNTMTEAITAAAVAGVTMNATQSNSQENDELSNLDDFIDLIDFFDFDYEVLKNITGNMEDVVDVATSVIDNFDMLGIGDFADLSDISDFADVATDIADAVDVFDGISFIGGLFG